MYETVVKSNGIRSWVMKKQLKNSVYDADIVFIAYSCFIEMK